MRSKLYGLSILLRGTGFMTLTSGLWSFGPVLFGIFSLILLGDILMK